ncbi:hypothetical protein GCM10007977_001300 [Dactylosporangium sucinum]|uniref:Uncharacterized protein n=1 Tax=Dactylosporangium sucinum TaxID=1424081 RepID=A0A917SZH5_9ACTN|nr:hypothetical protein GCM10007977_001300 [Dactylosporangium sucinum]
MVCVGNQIETARSPSTYCAVGVSAPRGNTSTANVTAKTKLSAGSCVSRRPTLLVVVPPDTELVVDQVHLPVQPGRVKLSARPRKRNFRMRPRLRLTCREVASSRPRSDESEEIGRYTRLNPVEPHR